MEVSIEKSWQQVLDGEFQEPYFKDLTEFVKNEYRKHSCYPRGTDIFKAFDHCPFHRTKVIILGQDPYHGVGQANGLCFSVKDGIPHPPSLRNIFKELEADVNKAYPISGDLSAWAEQGVLLLNATLTVRAGKPGSHQGQGWERFTDAVIQRLSEDRAGIVFLLWGGYAKKKARRINGDKHIVLTAGHPSPLSANRGYWFGNGHFSKTNAFLIANGQQPIDW